MNFEKKYLKYKNKYFNQKGGVADTENTTDLKYSEELIQNTKDMIPSLLKLLTYPRYAIIVKLDIRLGASEPPTDGIYPFTLKLEIIKSIKGVSYKWTIIHKKKYSPSVIEDLSTELYLYELKPIKINNYDAIFFMKAIKIINDSKKWEKFIAPKKRHSSYLALQTEFINLLNEIHKGMPNTPVMGKLITQIGKVFTITVIAITHTFNNSKWYIWTIIPNKYTEYKEYIIVSPCECMCLDDIYETFFNLYELEVTPPPLTSPRPASSRTSSSRPASPRPTSPRPASPKSASEINLKYSQDLINQTKDIIPQLRRYINIHKGYAIIVKLGIPLDISETHRNDNYPFTLKLELITTTTKDKEDRSKCDVYKWTIIHNKKEYNTLDISQFKIAYPTGTKQTLSYLSTPQGLYLYELEPMKSYPSDVSIFMNTFAQMGPTNVWKKIMDPLQIQRPCLDLEIQTDFITLIDNLLKSSMSIRRGSPLINESKLFIVKLEQYLYYTASNSARKWYLWTITHKLRFSDKEYIIASTLEYICPADICETFFNLYELKAVSY